MNRSLSIPVRVALVIGSIWTSSAEASKQVGLAVFGGYGTYSMSDVNEAIDTPGFLFPGATVSAEEVNGGAAFGVGVRIWQSESVLLALDASRLLAKTSGSAVFLGNTYDGELSVPATSVTFTVNYLLPGSGSLRFGIGGGAGYYICTGEGKVTGPSGSFSSDLDGSGFGFHAQGIGDLALSGNLHAEIGLGYRYAKTTDVESEVGVLENADGSKAQVDWSGLTTRVGLTLIVGGNAEAR